MGTYCVHPFTRRIIDHLAVLQPLSPPPWQLIGAMAAGTDTTAVTPTRMLQVLATADDGEEIIDKLIEELCNDATSDDGELDATTGTGSGGASRVGILGAFPLLNAVLHETSR